ncbi:PPE domain-containing protein [Gordonia sp. (in: high G+C Gram-positive bacteria)]|uniref:PPE domain-containing protein n=1 Tax=Gordonia sp. (in: high G+C Gram-positive bacteria) TaxID=84139 RepID=UPI0039E46491
MTVAQAGFTGVDWSSRPTERLQADLIAGAGLGPLADSAAAWSDLVGDFDELAVVARRAVDRVRAHWDSAGAGQALRALSRLPAWIDALAVDAARRRELCRRAESSAEAALLAMPGAAVLDEARAQANRLATGIGISAMMTGGLARAARTEAELSATAARVMADYERDSADAATDLRRPCPPPAMLRVRAVPSGIAPTGSTGIVAPVTPPVVARFRPALLTTQRPAFRTGAVPAAVPADQPRSTGAAPIAPVTGAPASASRTGPGSTADLHPGVGHTDTADEPLTWAQLLAHDDVRVDPAEGLGLRNRAV